MDELGLKAGGEREQKRRVDATPIEDLVAELRRVAKIVNRPPTGRDMKEYSVYSNSPYYRVFDSFQEAREYAGIDEEVDMGPDEIPSQDLIDEFERLAEELGRTPLRTEMRNQGRYSSQVYFNRWGSWPEACKAAGYEPIVVNRQSIEEWKLAWELRRLANEHGLPVIRPIVREHSEYNSKAYRRAFGNYTNAQRAAGLETYHEKRRKDGVNDYGPNWEEQREKALDRDNRRCQHCGIGAKRHTERYGFGPSVHHIVPAREFDDYEIQNELSNLVTLCSKHHPKWEGIPLRPTLL